MNADKINPQSLNAKEMKEIFCFGLICFSLAFLASLAVNILPIFHRRLSAFICG